MGSRRILWIGLIIAVLILIVTICVSCGTLFSSLPDYLEELPDVIIEEPINATEPRQEIDYANLPTPALKVDVPAFAEGELPVGAVVQIVVDGLVNGYSEQWSGSGSIISPDGLILTNAHVAVGNRFYRADRLTISLTVAEDKPPVPAYIAEVVQADTNLDIAVLRIIKDISGQRINTDSLGLPFVEIGNSDGLRLGDDITIMGYPGIGGQTITLTSGKVSGFTSEAGYGNRAFIKTSATIAGGNSGGLATDAAFRLVGIPTQVGAGELTGDVVDCRPLADTNRDGYINEYDTCVPTGGFINALRPVNLAIPLINAAIEGKEQYEFTDGKPNAKVPLSSEILFEDNFSGNGPVLSEAFDLDGGTYYQNGKYFFEVKNEYIYIPRSYEPSLTNMIISVESRVEQSIGNGDHGVLCRYQNDENFYAFEISQDGYFAIFKVSDQEWYPLIDFTYSESLVNIKEAVFNVACVGNTLTFAVNNVLLGEVNDNSFTDGRVGFFAGTFDTAGNIVSFDNLKVSLP